MELGGIKNKIKGVLGAIGREMDRWDEADRRLGTRVWQELNPPRQRGRIERDYEEVMVRYRGKVEPMSDAKARAWLEAEASQRGIKLLGDQKL